jgi:hypothetical protein
MTDRSPFWGTSLETWLSRIRKALSPRSRSQLLRDARYTTDWIA